LKASGDIRTLVVEDELIIAEDIKTKLISLGYNIVGVAATFNEALALLENNKPDIAILDIMLRGEKDGINLAEIIQNQYKIPFIFLTSYADKTTVERARQVMPDGYLVKPFTDKDLFAAIEIAIFKKISNQNKAEKTNNEISNTVLHDCIFIKKDYLIIKIKFEDLLWIKADGNYLELYCRNNKKHLIRSTLKDFLKKLPGNIFLQTHKSYSVNISYIETIEHHHILIGNQQIPIGRLFLESVKKTLRIN